MVRIQRAATWLTSCGYPECRAETQGSRLSQRIRTRSSRTPPFRVRSDQQFLVKPISAKQSGFGGTHDYRKFAVGDGKRLSKVDLAVSRHDSVAGFRGDRALRCAGC